MNNRRIRYLVLTSLLCMLIVIPVLGVGCATEETPSLAPASRLDLSATLVPNVGLDIYVYMKQADPTTVPKDMAGTPVDVVAESLALWGVATKNELVLSGGLMLTSAADAAGIHSAILSQANLWTRLSDRTIYFVYGSGSVAEMLKSAITRNDFKKYDDQQALSEVAMLPDGGTTRLAGVGIVRPGKELTGLITSNIDPEALGMVNTLLKWASLQVITVGLYAPQPIDAAVIAREIAAGSILKSELGILASVKSGLPDLIVSPIVKRVLDGAGYPETKVGELALYKGTVDAGDGLTIPVMFRIDGNRIFAAMAGKESYAQSLLTSVPR